MRRPRQSISPRFRLPAFALLLAAIACQDTTITRPGERRANPTLRKDSVGTGYILRDGKPMRVTFEIRRGRGLFEGDIDLGPAELIARTEEELRTQVQLGSVNSDQGSRWPGGVVPYVIDANVPNQSRITDAFAHIQQNDPGVTFVPLNGQSSFILIVRTDDPNICGSSAVGRSGWFQELRIRDDCPVDTAIHELAHALGMWHEQSRCDRDNYVEILVGNIIPGRESQFDKHCGDGIDVDVYDEASIMHYRSTAYGIGSPPAQTIRSLRGLEYLMDQTKTALSAADARTINWMYTAPAPTITSITYPGGTPTVTWNAMPYSPMYTVRLYYRYSTFGSGNNQSWETTSGFWSQTTGTSIQDPGHPYTGSSFCIKYTHFPLEGWRKDYAYEVIANYPYINTPRATINAKVATSANCQTPPLP